MKVNSYLSILLCLAKTGVDIGHRTLATRFPIWIRKVKMKYCSKPKHKILLSWPRTIGRVFIMGNHVLNFEDTSDELSILYDNKKFDSY